ncbi:MAG: ATP-binding cassette domain-containing protein [Candidatus Thermoplasmatota archaeon]|jgi:energy-coupling factor transport system ATP-binding protein|nr:ATP-binding cassette domain-containing protein [Candidatus Thermoplasmatota archaeon]
MKYSVDISNFSWRFPTFTGIKKEYTLRNVNLKIKEGEVFGITGSTGSGKSTLCYVIAGLIPQKLTIPQYQEEEHLNGSVKILGEKIVQLSKSGKKSVVKIRKIDEGRVGLVKQDPESYFSHGSVMEELLFNLNKIPLSKDEKKERIKKALEVVKMKSLFKSANKLTPFELSTGEQQRLVIASFLAMKPEILILDEPTSDLDPVGKGEVIDAILAMKKESGITIIIVEQDPETLTRLADRVALMSKGEVVAVDEPGKIYSRSDIKRYIEVPELMELIGPTGEIGEKFAPEKVKDFRVSRLEKEKGKVQLEIKNVGYHYEDGTKALDNLNLKVHEGEFLSLVGPNGSGKSTISKIISGNLSGWAGKIIFEGSDISKKGRRDTAGGLIGYVFQNPDQQVLQGTVKDEIYSSLVNTSFDKTKYEALAEDALRKVNLKDRFNDDINALSRGEKRRLALASVIVTKPRLLMVDEPATGQDYKSSTEIMELLSEINNEGVTIMIITHDMRLVAEYTRRAIVMKEGGIIFDGSPEELFQNDKLMEESSLAPPQLVRISRKLKDSGILQDILLNAKEWLDLFRFESEKKNFEALKFVDLKRYARELAADILNRFGKPESIVYIERGGMVIGRLLSDFLSVRMIYPLRASYYTDDGIPKAHVHISEFEFSLSKNEGYILLVDDIADTGKTLKAAADELKKKTSSRIVTATVVYKPQSIMKPDAYVYNVDNDTWIVFDYEEIETLSRFMRKDNKEGLKFMEKNF